MKNKTKWIIGIVVVVILGGAFYFSNSSLQKGTLRMVGNRAGSDTSSTDLRIRQINVLQDVSPGYNTGNGTYLVVNTPANINATVTGPASGSSVSTTTRISLDGAVFADVETNTSPSGIANLSVPWTPSTTGFHLINVCADSLNQFTETYETNNCSALRVEVFVSLLPELEVLPLSLPAQVTAGASVAIHSSFRNIGNAASQADDMDISLYIDRVVRDVNTVSGRVDVNQVVPFEFNDIFNDPGEYAISVCVDGNDSDTARNNRVAEINESNNCSSSMLSVVAPTIEPATVQCGEGQYSCRSWSPCKKGKQTGTRCRPIGGNTCTPSSSPTRSC